ncbi:MAG: hypothetical protein LBV74_09875 [Tannerella sp.]|jgi:uncharacterized protein YciI|nr:hypothetical protein [Tannerella sp.]
MIAVVFYEPGYVTTDKIMKIYPRHKQVVDKFTERGKIIAIGPYVNPAEQNKKGYTGINAQTLYNAFHTETPAVGL